jgi:anti-sigma28 factor (negative regulator of flagellin synthesis)
MMKGQGRKDENNMQTAGRGEQESPGDGSREKNPSNLPGKEPGKKDDGFSSLPEFRGAAQTRVKGTLGEGDSSGVVIKGAPQPGKSELTQQEVVANYRRQAEQELNSERVPEALKETIRNYFISLENSESKK